MTEEIEKIKSVPDSSASEACIIQYQLEKLVYGMFSCFREMDLILSELGSEEAVYTLVCEWYKKDENAIPSEYVLQPISTGIPQYETETGLLSALPWRATCHFDLFRDKTVLHDGRVLNK